MRVSFQIRRLQVWLACVAILLNALAPSISHALDSLQGKSAAWVEICSMEGSRFVTMAIDHAPSSGDSTTNPQLQAAQHCLFCASHVGDLALPASAMAVLMPDLGPALLPPLFYHAPHPLFSWTAANPRAPPALL